MMTPKNLMQRLITAGLTLVSMRGALAEDPFEPAPPPTMETEPIWWDAPTGPFVGQPPCGVDELERLAVDIARRTLLAYHPHLAKKTVHTSDIQVRPEGDIVHTYARLVILDDDPEDRPFECEVFASLVYTRGNRRMFDVSYRDNDCIPDRCHRRTPEIVSAFNTQFESRDPLQMTTPLIGPRLDVLTPRSRSWIGNLFQGNRAWHVFNADDRERDGWLP